MNLRLATLVRKVSRCIAVAGLTIGALSACQPRDTSASARREQRPQRNPRPKQAYRIMMEIANTPEPFASMQGVAQYRIANAGECGARPGSAGSAATTGSLPFALEPTSETEFEGMVYADGMQDEDYFGQGVCRWELADVRVLLRTTETAGATVFIPHLAPESLMADKVETTYFWRGEFQRVRAVDRADFGFSRPGDFRYELRHDLFSITLMARRL